MKYLLNLFEYPRWVVILCALIPISWVINLIALIDLDADVRGTFGDMFGAANSFFTGAALVALIASIALQKKDVKLAKEDLRVTRETLTEQQKLTADQHRFIEEQSVEGAFFNLMSLLMELVNNIDLSNGHGGGTNGKDVFHVFVTRMKGRGSKAGHLAKTRLKQRKVESGRMASANDIPTEKIFSEQIYEEIYPDVRNDLGHYFRVLYNILKFLKGARSGKKSIYVDLVRAQLSDDELIIIFLNGLSSRGEKMKSLIEDFGLLKHLNIDDELYAEARGSYDAKAYGDM